MDAQLSPAKHRSGLAEPFISQLANRLQTAFVAYRNEVSSLDLGHGVLAVPVLGRYSSKFGVRRDPMTRRRRMHAGIDVAARRGTPVRAAAVGIVVKARRVGGYGRVVIVDHGTGVTTRYAHLHRLKVKRGEYVGTSTVIGTVGSSGRSTGPHLHFEVRRNGDAVDPIPLLHAPSRLLLAVMR